MLGRLFPETLFPRKLTPSAEKRLRLAQARAEEAIIRAHVDNALMFVDMLAEDLSFDRAIDSYVRVMGLPEPMASVVATRTLVVLGEDLVPYRRRAQDRRGDEEVRLLVVGEQRRDDRHRDVALRPRERDDRRPGLTRPTMTCPKCGTPMNHQAEKLVQPVSEATLVALLRSGALQRKNRRTRHPASSRPWPRR